ncbi:MAG: hypothetical protein AAFY22_12395 [Pseudomonadota bacterium]
MSPLETSVQTLADALDRLESRLDDQIQDAAADADAVDAARKQARVARGHLNDASETLGAVLAELKAMANASAQSARDAAAVEGGVEEGAGPDQHEDAQIREDQSDDEENGAAKEKAS